MITVSIAKLGSNIQDVEVEVGATVMDALRKASYSLDSVLSVKRNGSSVQMDTIVSDGDVLMVSQEKVKGGNDDDEVNQPEDEDRMIRLSFDVEKESIKPTSKAVVAFMSSQTTFEIVKTILNGRGVSMNYFKKLVDADGNEISIGEKLVDGMAYKIIIGPIEQPQEEDDEDDY